MSRKKMAKALAMLVLENDELRGKVVQLQHEVHDAVSRCSSAVIRAQEANAVAAQESEAEVMDLLAKLDTAKADHQRDTAQLQERVETLLEEGDRTKANLAAMQRDRDVMAAQVRKLLKGRRS